MIRVSDVSFAYTSPEGSRPALQRVSLELEPGRLVVVLGANGSGKSTLARLLDGLLLPDEGSVTVDGMDTRDPRTQWEVRSRVGLVFQDPENQIIGTLVEEDVAFGPENLGLPREEIRRRVDEALAAVGLAELRSREPHLLSGGQKQRLAIAGALAMNPAYLVFDEPTAMLDPQGRVEAAALIERLRQDGHGIMLVTHDLSRITSADEVLVLDRGRIAFAGTPEGLLARQDVLAAAGLALPPAGLLAEELRRLGAPIPSSALDAESVAEALWP